MATAKKATITSCVSSASPSWSGEFSKRSKTAERRRVKLVITEIKNRALKFILDSHIGESELHAATRYGMRLS